MDRVLVTRVWLAVGWVVSLGCAYAVGWFRGLRSAASVAVGTAHVMTSTIEYLFMALIAAIAIGGALYFLRPRTHSEHLPLNT